MSVAARSGPLVFGSPISPSFTAAGPSNGSLQVGHFKFHHSARQTSGGARDVARSTLLVKLLCAFYSAPIEQWSPSPLGTPMEGEIWDPLYETYMECTGVRGGVELSIRAEVFEDSASDFSTVFVTRRTASTAAEPG